MKEQKKAVLLLIPNDMSIKEKLCNEMNVKVNFYDKAKLMKINNVYYENNEKDYVVIEKTKKKELKNSLNRFDYLTDSRSHIIINRTERD